MQDIINAHQRKLLAEKELKAVVDIAFSTYKDVKKLSDKDKDAMLRVAKADREAFNALFPPVTPQERAAQEAGMSFTALTKKLMAEAKAKGRSMSFADAQNEASRLLRSRAG